MTPFTMEDYHEYCKRLATELLCESGKQLAVMDALRETVKNDPPSEADFNEFFGLAGDEIRVLMHVPPGLTVDDYVYAVQTGLPLLIAGTDMDTPEVQEAINQIGIKIGLARHDRHR